MSAADSSPDFHATQSACKDIVARAAYFVDTRDYEAFANLFTEDGQLTRPGGSPITGRADILATYRRRAPDRITRHLISNTLVDEVTLDSATAVSYVVLWSADAAQAVEAFGRKANPHKVVGEFRDNFVRTPDGWRISRREASFVMYSE